jgi:hypothetical protein
MPTTIPWALAFDKFQASQDIYYLLPLHFAIIDVSLLNPFLPTATSPQTAIFHRQ